MAITCFIRYRIDPHQRDAFARYAEAWLRIIPRLAEPLGGRLAGYWLPHEGSNVEAWGLIDFPGLAAYEAYRTRLKADPEARENFAFATSARLIAEEQRTFCERVEPFAAAPAAKGVA